MTAGDTVEFSGTYEANPVTYDTIVFRVKGDARVVFPLHARNVTLAIGDDVMGPFAVTHVQSGCVHLTPEATFTRIMADLQRTGEEPV